MANIPVDFFKELLGRVFAAGAVDQFRALMALLAAGYTHLAYPSLTPAYVVPMGAGVGIWLVLGILFAGADRLRRRRPRNRFQAMRPRLRLAHRRVTDYFSIIDNDDILEARRIERDLAKLGIHIDLFLAYRRDVPDSEREEMVQMLFILVQLSEDGHLKVARRRFPPPSE